MFAVPQAGLVPYEAHLLDAAASPLVAALPQYERSFRDHLLAGRAYWDTIQACSNPCIDRRLRCVCMSGSIRDQARSSLTAQGSCQWTFCCRSPAHFACWPEMACVSFVVESARDLLSCVFDAKTGGHNEASFTLGDHLPHE